VRIIAGRHRGRVLDAPAGQTTRPTSDRAREGLFNMLAHGGYGQNGRPVFNDADILEAFAGTGAFSLEALSRGAHSATLLDLDQSALAVARANAENLGEGDATHIISMDATQPRIATMAHDVVFLDPPYGSGLGTEALVQLAQQGWIKDGALVVIEVGAKETFEPPTGFTEIKERSFGAARFVIMAYKND
jgi:16S rRNA (guanine966-N2)-methyltransferase